MKVEKYGQGTLVHSKGGWTKLIHGFIALQACLIFSSCSSQNDKVETEKIVGDVKYYECFGRTEVVDSAKIDACNPDKITLDLLKIFDQSRDLDIGELDKFSSKYSSRGDWTLMFRRIRDDKTAALSDFDQDQVYGTFRFGQRFFHFAASKGQFLSLSNSRKFE